MAFKTFDRKVYFALETTEGTRVAPHVNTGYLETTDPTYSVTNRVYDRNPTRMSITPAPAQIPGTAKSSGAPSAQIEFSFSVELAGSGTVGTAPRWGTLLKACGMSQVALSSIATDLSMTGGTTTPACFRHYSNFSTHASNTTWADAQNVGRVIGDTFRDETSLYYVVDSASTTVIADNDLLTNQIEDWRTQANGTATATAGVGYVMTSGATLGGANSSSLTIQMPLNSNGDYIEGVGCRGTVSMAFASGDRVMLNFTFTGRLNQYAEGGTFTPTAEGRPIPPGFVGASLAIGESTYGITDAADYTGLIFNTMTIDLGNDITLRENSSAGSGYDVSYITGRTPTMTFNPDAVRAATSAQADFWDRFLSGETTRGSLTVGSVAGNKFNFKFPAAQFTGITDGNRDEVVVFDSTTTLTGGDYGSSVQERVEGATSTQTNTRLGTDNEFVLYCL